MTTTETNDTEGTDRNVSRQRPTESNSPSAEGTEIRMVTFKDYGTISKQNKSQSKQFPPDKKHLND